MRRPTAILLIVLLFSAAFVAGRGPAGTSAWPDSLRSADLYFEGIERLVIDGDTARAASLFGEAVRRDSTYAPAYYAMAAAGMGSSHEERAEWARRAWRQDTTDRWYHRLYGQTLIFADRYDEALQVYRRLRSENPRDPDIYRLLAALYEQTGDPYMALATLDSAEVRFGRIPYLSAQKSRLLLATRQTDKAIAEAQALVDATPYEVEPHVALADLYGMAGRDSLARAEYDRAMRIDSTNLGLLMSLSDFHTQRRDYRALLGVARRLFLEEDFPLDMKIRRFKQFTSDRRFYGEHYLQINELASILAMSHPADPRVVELYANHLIASGELEQALAHYKLHLEDEPPSELFFRTVIDIESYLQRPDSVRRYVTRALELFPGKIEFHLARGNLSFYAERYDEAAEIYRRALRHADNDSLRSAVWGLIGDTWHRKAETVRQAGKRGTGEMKRCYAAYERGLGYEPDNANLLNNYAYFLALEGRQTERAVEMARRAVELTDNNPTYLDTYAWALFRAGNLEEARRVIRQAVALDGQQSPELLIHYGDILEAAGERTMAEIYWRKAQEKGYDAEEVARRLARPKEERR